MTYVAVVSFKADGKEIRRGAQLKDKDVKAWKNYMMLVASDYIRYVAE